MNDVIIETGFENVKDAHTEEELDAILNGTDNVDLDDEGNIIDKTTTPPKKTDDDSDDNDDDGELPKPGQKKQDKQQAQPASKDEGKGEETTTDEDEQYDNVIQFLDKKHGLGLNLAELPANMTREDEAELVSNLFERVVNNANAHLRQFEHIAALLEDDEVVALLQAKSEGKGLKDLFATYSTSLDGMSDEQLVFDDLKKKYPKLSETALNNMIAAQKEKGQFAEIATAIREQRKEDEAKSAAQRAKQEEEEAARRQQEYQQEVQQFTDLVNKVQKINGVAFTEDMKSEVLNFALKRNEEGLTQLDVALQSDVGILRASLGIILLERLMGAQASVLKNQGKKSVFEKLMTKVPEGSGSARKTEEKIPDEIFNKF